MTDSAPKPQWTAEREVPAALAASLVGSQFPQLRDAHVELLATGWDNTVYLVGGQWIFRFPRREIVLPGLRREIAALPKLAPMVPLPVPVPELIGTPTDEFPWPFWGARALQGRELVDSGLPDDARVAPATDMGSFLRALHDLPPSVLADADLLVDPMGRGDPARRAVRSREELNRLWRAGLWEPDPEVERVLRDGEKLGVSTGPTVVAHGDLHVRHVLVDRSGRATGVIDWIDLCLADPAVDVSLAYGAFAGRARAAFFEAYGQIDSDCELRARVLAVNLCAVLAAYAAAEGRATLLSETLAGLRRAVSD